MTHFIDESVRVCLDFARTQDVEIEFDRHPVTNAVRRIWVMTPFDMKKHPMLEHFLIRALFEKFDGKWCWKP